MRAHPIHYAAISLIVIAAIAANIALVFMVRPGSAAAFVVSGASETPVVVDTPVESAEPVVSPNPAPPLVMPIADAARRVTKKPFGLNILPGHSPVVGDRFTGHHVGVDFETFENEQDVDVPIYAICDGVLLFKQYAKGYGGLAVQKCVLEGREVTVMYGHLRLASIESNAGDDLVQGQPIGVLGQGYSLETDGVRKHLHLGTHLDAPIDIRGYVQDASEVDQWVDALRYMAL